MTELLSPLAAARILAARRRRLPCYFVACGDEESAEAVKQYLYGRIGRTRARRMSGKGGLPTRLEAVACSVVIASADYPAICGNTKLRFLLGYVRPAR